MDSGLVNLRSFGFCRDAVQKLALTQYPCPANILAVPPIECIDCYSVYLNV